MRLNLLLFNEVGKPRVDGVADDDPLEVVCRLVDEVEQDVHVVLHEFAVLVLAPVDVVVRH